MNKRILINAGNTRVPIDRVRGMDNIFKGKTGAAIAEYFALHRCFVTLLTSHPEFVKPCSGLDVVPFKTYEHFFRLMEDLVQTQPFDVIVQSAAVSDYGVDGAFEQVGEVRKIDGKIFVQLKELDRSGKISSDHNVLWLRTAPTKKIIDLIRKPYNFKGTLVKFKLQVGMPDDKLIEIATRSMKHSGADFIVANTLEEMNAKAFIISNSGGQPVCVTREELPARLYRALAL